MLFLKEFSLGALRTSVDRISGVGDPLRNDALLSYFYIARSEDTCYGPFIHATFCFVLHGDTFMSYIPFGIGYTSNKSPARRRYTRVGSSIYVVFLC